MTREIFWNLGPDKRTIVYLLGAAALAIFFFGLYRRYFLWRKMSRIDEPFSLKGLGRKIQLLLIDGLFQGRLLRETYPGFMHAFILWGFVILFLGTLTIALQEDITLPIMDVRILRGSFYVYYKLFLNIAGLLALAGILMAFVRRYLLKPSRLTRGYEFGIILLWIFVILVTGFLLEGLRIHSLKNRWEVWSLGGWLISEMISGWSPQESSLLSLHKIFWWSHLFLSFGLIAYIPFSKLLHLFTSPVNILFHGTTPQGVLAPVRDFSEPYSFGVSQVEDFTPSQLFDFDACTECGRCQDNCPAHLSEKPLSPKKAIQELKEKWLEMGRLLRRGEERGAEGRASR